MKITTLLHSVQPDQFRKYAFKSILRMAYINYFVFLYFSLIFQYLATTSGFAYSAGATVFLALILPPILAARLTTDSRLRANNRSAFDRKRLIEFDEEGYLIRFDSGSYTYTTWSDVESVKEQDGITIIHLTKLYTHTVPNAAWPSATEFQQFMDLLRAKSLLK